MEIKEQFWLIVEGWSILSVTHIHYPPTPTGIQRRWQTCWFLFSYFSRDVSLHYNPWQKKKNSMVAKDLSNFFGIVLNYTCKQKYDIRWQTDSALIHWSQNISEWNWKKCHFKEDLTHLEITLCLSDDLYSMKPFKGNLFKRRSRGFLLEEHIETLWFRIKVVCLVKIKTAVHSVDSELSLLFLSAVHS